jgi:hypothetical protein
MYSCSFSLIQGGIMDLPTWYFNVSFGVLVVAAILYYGID